MLKRLIVQPQVLGQLRVPSEVTLFQPEFESEVRIEEEKISVNLLEDDLEGNWVPAGNWELTFENDAFVEGRN